MFVRQLSAITLAVLSIASSRPAEALPLFADAYGFSCEQCHSVVPHLNAFGQAFLRAGFRLPASIATRRAFPLSVKVNLAYSSRPDPAQLPKSIVDELELLTGGPVSRHVSYRLEQYLIDGGVPGKTRDAWLAFTSAPAFGSSAAALRLTAGQFTLPLPVDPETQRDTLNHYAIFDQTIGKNPFNFFDDRIGLDAAYGRSVAGPSVHFVFLEGRDPQSHLRPDGIDRMALAQDASVADALYAYRYDGLRKFGLIDDRFWRQAFGLTHWSSRGTFDALVQTGFDSNPAEDVPAVHSSAGFAQLRWEFSPRYVGDLRFDRTSDALAGAHHSVTAAMIYRTRRNERLTIEEVFSGGGVQTLNAAWLFAY
ncbi:MAG TPA: hypothetical protein VID19_10635 [Candidatus Eremiobacteraceae bacterium]|jgi:hypothetical protein